MRLPQTRPLVEANPLAGLANNLISTDRVYALRSLAAWGRLC